MALKSLLTIDIDDSKFRNFQRMYAAYHNGLKSHSAAWALVSQKIDGSRSAFDKLVAKMVVANVQTKLIEKAQAHADQLTRSTADRWRDMAKSSATFAVRIKDATLQLLRWGALTGVISGIVGAGGLFGIDRLAMNVAAGRRSSLGLGVGYGEQQSFQSNFARLVDPDAFLSSVAGAKLDVTRRVGLLGAGLTEKEIGGSNNDTAIALIRNLKRIADTTNPALYQQVIAGRRLEGFTSPEDLQRFRNMSPQEIESLIAKHGVSSQRNDVGPDIQRRWQEFSTQLSNAGRSIESTFVRGLDKLTPGLLKLSESVEGVIRSFLDSPTLGKWLTEVNTAVEGFASYVGTPEFQKDVKSFADGIGEAARTIWSVIKWLAPKVKAVTDTAVPVAKGAGTLWDILGDIKSGNIDLLGKGAAAAGKDVAGNPLTTFATSKGTKVTVAADAADRFKGFLDTLEKSGAPIANIGSFNPRRIAGTNKWSEHAFGRAVDIEQKDRDVVSPEFREWAKAHADILREAQKRFGIESGGDWRRPDFGHFEAKKGGAGRYVGGPGEQVNVGITVTSETGGNVNASVNGLK